MRHLPLTILLAIIGLSIFSSCKEEKRYYVDNIDEATTPTMVTYNVATFISDSGYIKYYIEAPLWRMFEYHREDDRWTFPEGLEFTEFSSHTLLPTMVSAEAEEDSILRDADHNPADTSLLTELSKKQVQMVMRCDSAINFRQKDLWRFDGRVVVVNIQGDTLLTERLYYDKRQERLYSDTFVRFIRAGSVVEGKHFTSNNQMRDYVIYEPQALMPAVKEENDKSEASEADQTSGQRLRRQPIPERSSRQGDQPELYNF